MAGRAAESGFARREAAADFLQKGEPEPDFFIKLSLFFNKKPAGPAEVREGDGEFLRRKFFM